MWFHIKIGFSCPLEKLEDLAMLASSSPDRKGLSGCHLLPPMCFWTPHNPHRSLLLLLHRLPHVSSLPDPADSPPGETLPSSQQNCFFLLAFANWIPDDVVMVFLQVFWCHEVHDCFSHLWYCSVLSITISLYMSWFSTCVNLIFIKYMITSTHRNKVQIVLARAVYFMDYVWIGWCLRQLWNLFPLLINSLI